MGTPVLRNLGEEEEPVKEIKKEWLVGQAKETKKVQCPGSQAEKYAKK